MEGGRAHGAAPSDIDLWDDTINYRTQYRVFAEKLEILSAFVQELRARAAKEDAQLPTLYGQDFACYASGTAVRALIRKHFDQWSMALFSHFALMREVRHFDDKSGSGGAKHDALGMHVWLELTQLNAQLARPALLVERENLATIDAVHLGGATHYDSLYSLATTTHPLWVQALNSFECPPMPAKEDDDDVGDRERVTQLQERMRVLWRRPVMEATQREVRLLVMFLTQQLRSLPTRDATLMAEYRRVFQLLWLRVAMLTNQTWPAAVLDDEEARQPVGVLEPRAEPVFAFNRNFAMFCFFYMSEVQRSLYHYDLLRQRPPLRDMDAAALGTRVFDWLSRIVMAYADDAFEDLYSARAVQDGYRFVGDDEYFKYAFPNNVHSRGACITLLRPHLYRAYYSEVNLSKRVVLGNAARGDYVASLFVMEALHEYLRIHTPRVSWLSGCVVDAGAIDASAYVLTNVLCPVLVQVVSTYWVYVPREHGGPLVHVCDNIYESIGVWFWALHTYFADRLYDVDCSMYMKDVLVVVDAQPQEPAQQDVEAMNFEL